MGQTQTVSMKDQLRPWQSRKTFIDDSAEIVRLMREQAPAHCVLKVESFSRLQESLSKTNKKYFESPEFDAGSHKWVLRIYPKGIKKDEKVGDCISFYVEMVDEICPSNSVNAMLRFFVYDQIRDKYLNIMDVREKRFNTLKNTWGIPNALSNASFAEALNGFLVDDCCIFGAEVLVIDSQLKTSHLRDITAICERKFSWRVENYSTLSDVRSPVFKFNDWSGKLSFYPKGYGTAKNKCLSLFLDLDTAVKPGRKLYTQFHLNLINQSKGANHSKTASTWFSPKRTNWGFLEFISLNDVQDLSKGFLLNDTLVVEVVVDKLFLMKEMNC